MAASDNIIESTRVTDFEGNQWPCFVFPDHSVPHGSIESKPNKQALPVLLLERHVFAWRSRDALNMFEPFEERTFGVSKAEHERKQAFVEAMEFNNMDHYYDLTWNKQADLELKKNAIVLDDSDDDLTITPSTKKRPFSSSLLKRPGLPSPSPTPKRQKLSSKVQAPAPAQPFGEDNSDVDLPSLSMLTPTKKPKKQAAEKKDHSQWKPSGKAPMVAADDYVTRKQLELLMIKKGDGKPSLEKAEVLEPVKDPLKLNIYVGDEKKLFILDRALIQKYPTFMKHITGDTKNGFKISNPVFEKFKPASFESLISWLNTADYTPRLMDGEHPYLHNVKSAGQFEEAAEAASVLWNIAHKLDLTTLQELISRKIEVQTPLATNSLLLMTRMVFWNSAADTEIDGKMRQMLKHDIATRFHEILEEEPLLFSRVVKSDVELANYIFLYQIENPWNEPAKHYPEEDEEDEDGEDDE